MPWTRKLLTYLVAATLALANGVAPGGAHAAAHHMAAAAQAQDHHHGQAGAGHQHEAGDAVAKTEPCHDGTEPASGAPDHACCIASCSAAALIFAAADFGRHLAVTCFVAPVAPALHSAATAGIDRPPRLA